MAPFPYMVVDSLSPINVIGKTNPVTNKPFQPPDESLVIEVRSVSLYISILCPSSSRMHCLHHVPWEAASFSPCPSAALQLHDVFSVGRAMQFD